MLEKPRAYCCYSLPLVHFCFTFAHHSNRQINQSIFHLKKLSLFFISSPPPITLSLMVNTSMVLQRYPDGTPLHHYARFLHQPRAYGVSSVLFLKMPPDVRHRVVLKTVQVTRDRFPGLTPPTGGTSGALLFPVCTRPTTLVEALFLWLRYGGALKSSADTTTTRQEHRHHGRGDGATTSIAITDNNDSLVCMDDIFSVGLGEVMYAPDHTYIPTHMYDRIYEHQVDQHLPLEPTPPPPSTSPLHTTIISPSSSSHPPDRMPPHIQSHDVLMLIFSFLPAEMPTLLAVGTVCRAWRERSEYLAPHWDLVVANSRTIHYWAGVKKCRAVGGSNAMITSASQPVKREEDEAAPPQASSPLLDVNDNDSMPPITPLFHPSTNRIEVRSNEPSSTTLSTASTTKGGRISVVEEEDPIVVARRKAYFPLVIHSRSDLLSKRYLLMIRDEETRECIVAMRALGGVVTTGMSILLFIIAAVVGYVLGVRTSGLDSYLYVGVTYFFSMVAVLVVFILTTLVLGCRRQKPFTSKNADFVARYWTLALLFVLGFVMALLCLRFRVVSDFIDLPRFTTADRLDPILCPCGVPGEPSCTPPLLQGQRRARNGPPSMITAPMPVGLGSYRWATPAAMTYSIIKEACFGYDNVSGACSYPGNTTTSIHFLLAVSNTSSSSSGCAATYRMFALQVENPRVTTHSLSISDPLTALTAVSRGGVVREGNSHDGKAIEIKVPFESTVLDAGFDGNNIDFMNSNWYAPDNDVNTTLARTYTTEDGIFINTTAGLAAQYLIDNTPEPWRDAAIPIVRWEGDGGVEGLIRAYTVQQGKHPWRAVHKKAQYKSFETMKKEITGAWAAILCGGIAITLLLNLCYCLSYVPQDPLATRNYHSIKPQLRPLRYIGRIASRRIRVVTGWGIGILSLLLLNPILMGCWGLMCFMAPDLRDVCLAEEAGMVAMMCFGFISFVILTILYIAILFR